MKQDTTPSWCAGCRTQRYLQGGKCRVCEKRTKARASEDSVSQRLEPNYGPVAVRQRAVQRIRESQPWSPEDELAAANSYWALIEYARQRILRQHGERRYWDYLRMEVARTVEESRVTPSPRLTCFIRALDFYLFIGQHPRRMLELYVPDIRHDTQLTTEVIERLRDLNNAPSPRPTT